MEEKVQANTTVYIAIACILVLIIGGIGFFTSKSLSNNNTDKSNIINSSSENVALNVAKPYVAPEFAGIDAWINSNGEKLSDLKGKVILIDFWTFSCINCLRTLPYVTSWYDKYKDDGFVVIGMHAPEFAFEHKLENVQKAVKDKGISYPVALDNNFTTWRAFKNQYWPAHYFIDKEGRVRHTHFGEGEYDTSEKVIQLLLSEGGDTITKPLSEVKENSNSQVGQSPETYLGYKRGERFANTHEFKADQIVKYSTTKVSQNSWGLGGEWIIKDEKSVSKSNDSMLSFSFSAKEVYLVMGSENEGTVTVKVNGKPVSSSDVAGDDVDDSKVKVKEFRLYKLVKSTESLKNATIELQVSKDVEVHAFTFGS